MNFNTLSAFSYKRLFEKLKVYPFFLQKNASEKIVKFTTLKSNKNRDNFYIKVHFCS